jgi:transposase
MCYASGVEAKRPFNQLEWLLTPEPVRAYIIYLEKMISAHKQQLQQLEERTEKLELRAKINSQNSSKPPSSDNPFNKQKKKTKNSKRKRGGQKGHKGHKQQMLDPSQTKNVLPDSCDCVIIW